MIARFETKFLVKTKIFGFAIENDFVTASYFSNLNQFLNQFFPNTFSLMVWMDGNILDVPSQVPIAKELAIHQQRGCADDFAEFDGNVDIGWVSAQARHIEPPKFFRLFYRQKTRSQRNETIKKILSDVLIAQELDVNRMR